jgi:predicted ArsR family transcriptional regulator
MIAPDAQPGGEPLRGYRDLGRWLTGLMASGKTSRRAIEAAGREIGRELAPEAGAVSAEPVMHATLASMGFQPRRERSGGEGLTYRLGNCPYRDAARESQQVVCTLHRGITRGLLDELSPETALTGFVPKDPYEAGCLIELRRGLAEERPAGGREAHD